MAFKLTLIFFTLTLFVLVESKMRKPKLIVFDLDHTLWPFWVETDVKSPITKDKDNQVVDGEGNIVKPYPEVPAILERLSNEGYTLGVASTSSWPEGAHQLLTLYDWDKYFKFEEIYSTRKLEQFKKIHETTGISYSDMLFFDDEERNIVDMKSLGVISILVPDGLNEQVVKEGFCEFGNQTDKKHINYATLLKGEHNGGVSIFPEILDFKIKAICICIQLLSTHFFKFR